MLNFNFQGNRKLRDEVTSSRLNAILDELRRIRPVAGRGVNIQQEGNGSRISVLDAVSVGGGSSVPPTPQPWDLIIQRDPEADPEDENPDYVAKVRPGTISDILPTNWDDEFVITPDTVFYATAIIATDGQDLTSVTIDISTELPQFETPTLFSVPGTVDLLFGIAFNQTAYRIIGPGSPTIRPRPWITVEKPSAGVGQLPYDIYYTLLP